MLRRTELTLLLVTLDWISEPDLRRSTGQELNKGEARNSLARAVFIRRLGEIRDRTCENQQHPSSVICDCIPRIRKISLARRGAGLTRYAAWPGQCSHQRIGRTCCG